MQPSAGIPDSASVPERAELMFQLKRHPFAAHTIEDAPGQTGIYFLWEDDELTYVGIADGDDTVRSRLRDHLQGHVLCPCVATYCSWKLSPDPKGLAMDMLAEYARHLDGKPPRCNFVLAREG